MDKRKQRNEIQHALNSTLSGLRDDPWLAQRVIAEAKGEKSAKRKLPIALFVALAIMLIGAVAVAATLLWQDYVPQLKQAEWEMGDYAQWPNARRIQLAQDMIAMGYANESEAVAILQSDEKTEKEKAAAADHFMMEFTGLEDVGEIHSTLITYSIMGHEDTWTAEQRAWWNGIINMYTDTDAPDTLLVPDENDLSEETAIAIAQAAVQQAYGFSDDYMASLHAVANLYVTEQRPNYERWDIQFKKYRDNSTYLEKVYSVVVDENGEVISDPDVGTETPAEKAERDTSEAARRMEQQQTEDSELEKVYSQYGNIAENQNIWRMTLEERATQLGDDQGIPSSNDITETEAVQIASNWLASIGYSIDSYEISVWYKTYDNGAAAASQKDQLYAIYFLDDLERPTKAFSVTLDAITGEVIHTHIPESISRY